MTDKPKPKPKPKPSYDPKEIGRRIAVARDAKNLTQAQLAARLGKTEGTISNWETGRHTPLFDDLIRAADFLEIPRGEIVAPERELLETQELLALLPGIADALPGIVDALVRIEALLHAREDGAQAG